MTQTIKKSIGEGFAKGELYAALAYDETDRFGGLRIKGTYTAKTSAATTGTIRGNNIALTMTAASTANVVEALYVSITSNVKTGAWANAIVGKIDYSTSGAAHGMAAAICAEMIPPNSSLARGSLYALDLEFGCGASSTWGSAGPVAFFKMENWGTKTHFSDNAFMFHLLGETSGTGNLLYNNTIRVRVGTTSWYLPLSSAEGTFTTVYPIVTTSTIGLTLAALTAGDAYSGLRLAVTAAAPNNAYGMAAYFDTTITGTTTGHCYGVGSWINTATTPVLAAGHIIVPFEGGVYTGEAQANARIVFGGQHQAILNGAPASLHAWRLNTNQTITAVIAAANAGSIGFATGETASTSAGTIAIADIVGTGVVYIQVYTTSA